MKYLLPVLLVGAMLAVSGCNKSKPGGPGANLPKSEQASMGQTDDSFSLVAPMTATKLAQGEVKEIALGIKRGTNFDQDITLAFADVPAGLVITPAAPNLGHGDTEAKLSLTAAADAALGDFTVKVSGRPGKGQNAMVEFKVTITTK